MATVSINEGWSAILCTKNYWCLAERIKYKLLSLTYKVLTINQPQYPHDLISVQPCHKHVLHLWSLFAACSPTYPDIWKSQIDLFGMLHLVYGTNSPLIASLVRQSPALSPITHGSSSFSPSSLSPLVQHFILTSRVGSSANPFLHSHFPFLPDWFHGLSDHLMILLCSTAGFVCIVC